MTHDTKSRPAADAASVLLSAYVEERLAPHPILGPALERAAVCVIGSVAIGTWDEHSDFDVVLLVPDEEHARLAQALRDAGLWDPARDARLFLVDREPFRRFPGAEVMVESPALLERSASLELPVVLWIYAHAMTLQDPLGILEREVRSLRARFQAALPDLRCEHYFHFRRARNDLLPRIMPRRLTTVMAMKRGDTVREALRLAFLADGKPYPYDKWLEVEAERETKAGASIVPAVRAFLAAQEPETVDHTSKVLRDRVIFALQQGGVSERWLEQWWLWPTAAVAGRE